MQPEDLSTNELKKFRKTQVETIQFANSPDITLRANIVITMIDKELEKRGIDTKKMFNKE